MVHTHFYTSETLGTCPGGHVCLRAFPFFTSSMFSLQLLALHLLLTHSGLPPEVYKVHLPKVPRLLYLVYSTLFSSMLTHYIKKFNIY